MPLSRDKVKDKLREKFKVRVKLKVRLSTIKEPMSRVYKTVVQTTTISPS